MTLLDEEVLRVALAQAANEFSVSTTHPDRILEHASTSGATERMGRIDALYLHFGRTRSIVMSLAASVLVVAVAVPLFLSEVPSATSGSGVAAAAAQKKFVVHGEQAPIPKFSNGDQGLATTTGTGYILRRFDRHHDLCVVPWQDGQERNLQFAACRRGRDH